MVTPARVTAASLHVSPERTAANTNAATSPLRTSSIDLPVLSVSPGGSQSISVLPVSPAASVFSDVPALTATSLQAAHATSSSSIASSARGAGASSMSSTGTFVIYTASQSDTPASSPNHEALQIAAAQRRAEAADAAPAAIPEDTLSRQSSSEHLAVVPADAPTDVHEEQADAPEQREQPDDAALLADARSAASSTVISAATSPRLEESPAAAVACSICGKSEPVSLLHAQDDGAMVHSSCGGCG